MLCANGLKIYAQANDDNQAGESHVAMQSIQFIHCEIITHHFHCIRSLGGGVRREVCAGNWREVAGKERAVAGVTDVLPTAGSTPALDAADPPTSITIN
ncbi:hypothetical protein J6590_028587 [Homalodisca vitripennis]|nr:hypothetical protein J6590_028587 [Homalodisca vitripennis]